MLPQVIFNYISPSKKSSPIKKTALLTLGIYLTLSGFAQKTYIQASKLVDIIAVVGDPSKDIEVMKSVIFVMKEGKVYKAEN
ncbi:hypothetical protein SAMN04488104_1003108 [Algoriphagus faecimaris]|uniref:Amidohydrolase n=1 Tax=Algoriphagus faecimaris TaxID=686796 RepID=A0A1G6NGJ6_9BACT|nr:hypothetical protein SAMN04488104_1003108 [Algoriphagus faecimaris]